MTHQKLILYDNTGMYLQRFLRIPQVSTLQSEDLVAEILPVHLVLREFLWLEALHPQLPS